MVKNMVNTESYKKLIEFNKNMKSSSMNVEQRMFFIEEARKQRTEELVTADKLPELFREG